MIWHNGAVIDLGKLEGMDDSGATAINNLGQIVGSSGRMDPDTYEVFQTAFLYENGVMSPLPVPSWEAYASDINDAGVIVGWGRYQGRTLAFVLTPQASCYANCDESTSPPVLNVQDFTCFLQRYAAGCQ